MTTIPSESWQMVLRRYDRLGALPKCKHLSPFRALVEQWSSTAAQLNLFASESHGTLVISKNNNWAAPDHAPHVVVHPWSDGNLIILYRGSGETEELSCALAAGRILVEQYMNRLVTSCVNVVAPSSPLTVKSDAQLLRESDWPPILNPRLVNRN